jgi:hypothetical protein
MKPLNRKQIEHVYEWLKDALSEFDLDTPVVFKQEHLKRLEAHKIERYRREIENTERRLD